MLAPSTSAGPAASYDWRPSALGPRDQWTHTLRLAVDIVLATPSPLLLLWGPQRIAVFNSAYADMAGPFQPAVPGGKVPALAPPPLAAAAAAFDAAAAGNHLSVERQVLTFMSGTGPQQLECDLTLTPLAEADGSIGGVLCAIARSPERAAVPEAASGLRVLVVEDNLDSQYLVCEMLKAFGHHADGVGHGEGALEMLAASRYDVLFSDVSLPGISGVDLARKAIADDPSLQVIFASGYGEALLKHAGFPFQSLQKPYEIEQLQAALARIAPT